MTRNESAFIRACIESALPIVQEAIVVDTGSVDGTPTIARRTGAHVIEAVWPGDLGAAHDLPLAHARGEWILSLDGDELLDPQSRHLIPDLVAASHVDAFRLPIRNYSFNPEIAMRVADAGDPLTAGALCYYSTKVVRLHRRRRGYHHRGRLHQSLEPSIVQHDGAIAEAPVLIHHYGLLRTDRDKTPLYRILARRQVEDTPADPRAWYDLGMMFVGARLSGALGAFHRAYALGLRGPAAFMLGVVLIEGEQPAAAVPWLHRAIDENPGDDLVYYDVADAAEKLALAYDLLGQSRRAERALRRALELRPESSPAAANNLACLLFERGAFAEAERILAPLLERFPGLSTPRATLGVLRLRQRRLDDARRAFEQAVDIDHTDRGTLFNLALTHRLAGRRRAAALAFRAAAEMNLPQPSVRAGIARAVRAAPPRRMAAGGVVSLVSSLHGGAGRVCVDAVRALRGRPQVVLCAEPGEYAGFEQRRELEGARVALRSVASDDEARWQIARLQPACVINHACRGFFANGAWRVGSERWIAVGHAGVAMEGEYDAYVVLSAFHAQFQPHLPSHLLNRIPNGVDLRRFRPRSRRGTGRVTIVASSRLQPGKLPRQLLSYLPCLQTLGARLLIAGTGNRRYEIEPEIRARGLEGVVQFVGAIPSDRMHLFLGEADIGLHLTEIEQENCCMAVIEMLASGLPVIGQPKGCLPEMVKDGENGYLASAPECIADRLAELIRSPALRARMGTASRIAAKSFAMGRYRAQMRALVDRICRDGRSSVATGVPPANVEDISARQWQPALTYFVCAVAGSGSELLGMALSNTGLAGFPSEPRFDPAGWSFEERSQEPLRRRLSRDVEVRATPNGVSGAMVALPALQRLVKSLRAADPLERSPFEVLTAALPQLRLIRLKRRDRLRHAVSRVLAVPVDGSEGAANRFRGRSSRISERAVRTQLAAVAAEEAAWDGFLASWPEPPIEVHYEDLLTNCEATTRSLIRQLGITMPYRLSFATDESSLDQAADRWVRRMRKSLGGVR